MKDTTDVSEGAHFPYSKVANCRQVDYEVGRENKEWVTFLRLQIFAISQKMIQMKGYLLLMRSAGKMKSE